MMDFNTALSTAKGMLEKGELPNALAANVYIIKLMGVMPITTTLPRDVRAAYMAEVKAGELGRLPKKGLAPEIFFHKNAKGTAVATQERIAREKIEALRGVYATPNHQV